MRGCESMRLVVSGEHVGQCPCSRSHDNTSSSEVSLRRSSASGCKLSSIGRCRSSTSVAPRKTSELPAVHVHLATARARAVAPRYRPSSSRPSWDCARVLGVGPLRRTPPRDARSRSPCPLCRPPRRRRRACYAGSRSSVGVGAGSGVPSSRARRPPRKRQDSSRGSQARCTCRCARPRRAPSFQGERDRRTVGTRRARPVPTGSRRSPGASAPDGHVHVATLVHEHSPPHRCGSGDACALHRARRGYDSGETVPGGWMLVSY